MVSYDNNMIFKLIRIVLFSLLISTFGYYIVQNQNTDKNLQQTKLYHDLNSSNSIKYVKKFKGGILTLSAQKSKLITPNHILLDNMIAVFKKDGKEVIISGKVCNLKMNEKKAYINNNVTIKTLNTTCNTNFAIVDFLNNALYSNSKINGRRSGSNFVADGFSLNENGIVKLKHAVIKN